MGNYENLKAAIADVITTNGNNEITGAVLRQVLQTMVSSIGGNSTFGGLVTPETNVGTPDQNVFYVAKTPGVYQYMGGATVKIGEIVFFTNTNNQWVAHTIVLAESFASFVDGYSFDVVPFDDRVEVDFNMADGEPGSFMIVSATESSAGIMAAEDKKNVNKSIKDIVVNPNETDVKLVLKDNVDNTSYKVFPAASSEKAGAMTAKDKRNLDGIPGIITKEKNALENGDTIVGLAREVYSRQGKVDTATFLKRTTAGGTSVSDGVATLKQVGGNIVKNNLDAENLTPMNITIENLNGVIVIQPQSDGVAHGDVQLFVDSNSYIDGHVYYTSFMLKSNVWATISACAGVGYNTSRFVIRGDVMPNEWTNISGVATFVLGDIANNPMLALFPFGGSGTTSVNNRLEIFSMLSVDLTEMYGAGNEPTKVECDRMFGTMDTLPQGLTVAQPTGLKSIGYNQWNPANVLLNKSIVDNAIEDDVADRHIAIVECLPCKVGTGENNGYVIGHGEGDSWTFGDIDVYFSPFNPMEHQEEQEFEYFMSWLEPDSELITYVPQCKGYLLIVTPTIDKLCAHFHWSGDREITDYEEYVESNVALPTIPEMSEWGLAGISTSGVRDVIDLENNVYHKRINRIDLGALTWKFNEPSDAYPYGFFYALASGIRATRTNELCCDKYAAADANFTKDKVVFMNTIGDGNTIYLVDSSYTDAAVLKESLRGNYAYFPLATAEEYPIVTKTAPNYIGSDYGVEEFTDSKVPLAANILFYMRSLVSETRNFLDRLMARLGISDATAVADKIADAIIQTTEGTDVEPTEVIEE